MAAAAQEDADVIGLSILSGAHLPICRRVVELLRERGMDVGPRVRGRDHPAARTSRSSSSSVSPTCSCPGRRPRTSSGSIDRASRRARLSGVIPANSLTGGREGSILGRIAPARPRGGSAGERRARLTRAWGPSGDGQEDPARGRQHHDPEGHRADLLGRGLRRDHRGQRSARPREAPRGPSGHRAVRHHHAGEGRVRGLRADQDEPRHLAHPGPAADRGLRALRPGASGPRPATTARSRSRSSPRRSSRR